MSLQRRLRRIRQPFNPPAGYSEVPGATPEQDLGLGSNQNVDGGPRRRTDQSVIEGEIMPQENLAQPKDPNWATDPMFGGANQVCGPCKANPGRKEEGDEEEPVKEAAEPDPGAIKAAQQGAADSGGGSDSGNGSSSGSDGGSGGGSGGGSASGSGGASDGGSGGGSGSAEKLDPAPEALQMLEEATVEGEAGFRKAGSVSKGST